MLLDIEAELQRLNAREVRVALDAAFELEVGALVYIEIDGAEWHMLPGVFREVLKDLPDGAGSDAVQTAIERKGVFAWHGPSPKDSRDTSP